MDGNRVSEQHILVIGGGMTGMAAANALLKKGVRVTLVERDGRLGGKVGTVHEQGFLLDTGPDSFLAQKPAGVRLCKELGLGDEIIAPMERRFYMLIDGKLHTVPHELVSLAPTKPEALWGASFLSFWGKFRASTEGLVPRRGQVDDESLASFMRRRFGSEFALRFAEPLMGGVHASHPDKMSMAAVYPTYWKMEQTHGSVSRAILAMRRERMMKAPSKGAPSGASSAPFVALRRGMQSLVDRLAEALAAADVRTGVSVDALQPQVDGLVAATLSTGETVVVDRVLVTTPAWEAARLVRPHAPAAADLLESIRYASTAVATLAYREDQIPGLLPGTGFLTPRDQDLPITGCTWSSRKWEGRAPEGTVLMRAFMGYADNDAFVVTDTDEQMLAKAHNALAPLLGVKGEPAFSKLFRWVRAMPQYDVGHGALVSKINHSLGALPGVSLAGSSYGGVGIPDCIRQGEEAAALLLGG